MPRLRSIYFMVLAVLAFGWARPSAAQMTVTGMVSQSEARIRNNLPVYFTPKSTLQYVAPWMVISETVTKRTDTNGFFSVQLLQGYYNVRLGNITNDWMEILVESNSGTNDIHALATSTNIVFQTTNVMVGATAMADGLSGLVPQPLAGEQDFVLHGGPPYWRAVSSGGSTVTNLADIGDVVLTSPIPNQVLRFNGTNWVNATDTGGGNTFDQDNETTFTFDAE